MHKIKITAIRKADYKDLQKKYENPIQHACDIQEGQVFIANGWQRPEGMCESAIEHYPFPKDAVREAVFNALIHQDFSVGVPVQISVYKDKLYISNDCVFPANWTADTLMQKHRSLPHNPDIANTFFRAGFIESWGRGIEKICNLCKEYGIAEPEYTVHPNDIMMMFKANGTEGIKQENKSSKIGPKNKKWPEKWPEKAEQIINAVSEDNKITITKLEEILDIGHTTVKKILSEMQAEGYIRRVGADKGGHWEIV